MRILWILLLGSVLSGQTELSVEATGCRHTAGDDPAWARPDFDDSGWEPDLPKFGNPYTWSRCQLDLSALAVPGTFSALVQVHGAWELYIDGKLAASHGDIRNGRVPFSVYGLLPLSPSPERRVVKVALRRFSLIFGPGPSNPALRILVGAEPALFAINARDESIRLRSVLPALGFGAFAVLAGFLFLILFCSDWTQKELLWFGLTAASLGITRLLFVPGLAGDFLWIVGLWFFSNSLNYVSLVSLFYWLAEKSVPKFFVLVVCVEIFLTGYAGFALLFVPENARFWFSGGSYLALFLPYFSLILISAPVAAFWPVWRLPQSQYGVGIVSLFWFLGTISNQVAQLRWFSSWTLADARNLQAWFSAPSLLAMFVVVTLRFRRVSKERAVLQGEMKSAQEVQRLLTSSTLDVAPWAQVEVAYLPAKEVGGDFYFCRHTPEGQLIVVGDVSGKGLRAAMLASVALGAIRNSTSWSPGPLLQNLNAALYGQTGGGFVTCCAALLRNDGHLTLANAGHPSPYVDGCEAIVEAGLPLGIVADATYEEAVSRGVSVTLVSDGVVEAENAQRELFGFERTLAISKQAAQEIAEAARAWGQTDDITVLTVRKIS